MHYTILNKWQHDHHFEIDGKSGEMKTLIAIVLTTLMMVGEIAGGAIFGSMALLADGWHMGTHVAAFGITIFAYKYAAKNRDNNKFSFGTGKVTVLGGFASAMGLLVIALVMAIESALRFIEPQTIYYNESIIIAVIGLAVNAICAVTLHQSHHGDAGHHHEHEHHDEHEIDHHHSHDHNLKSAYYHVLADALTSVAAILGLVTAKYFGWVFMDALMGVTGSLVITKWAYGLLKETSPILLDKDSSSFREKIKVLIEDVDDNKIVDLHIWKMSPHHFAVIISLVTHEPQDASHYKNILNDIDGISHLTIEVNKCVDSSCLNVA